MYTYGYWGVVTFEKPWNKFSLDLKLFYQIKSIKNQDTLFLMIKFCNCSPLNLMSLEMSNFFFFCKFFDVTDTDYIILLL